MRNYARTFGGLPRLARVLWVIAAIMALNLLLRVAS
jgi:hypothetical protein